MTTEQTKTSDPVTTKQTTKRTTGYYPMTTTTFTQTRTKEDIIANDQITGNIIGINVVNRDDNIPYYVCNEYI